MIITQKLFVIISTYIFFCSKTMNLSKNNNGCIDLKNGYLTISVDSSRKNTSQKQDKIPKIGSGNKVVTLSYKSWDFGPIYARYGSNGFGVSSCSVVVKDFHQREAWNNILKQFMMEKSHISVPSVIQVLLTKVIWKGTLIRSMW